MSKTTQKKAVDLSSVTVSLTDKSIAMVSLVRLGYTWARAEEIVLQAPPHGRPARPLRPEERLLPDCDGDMEGPQTPAQLDYRP